MIKPERGRAATFDIPRRVGARLAGVHFSPVASSTQDGSCITPAGMHCALARAARRTIRSIMKSFGPARAAVLWAALGLAAHGSLVSCGPSMADGTREADWPEPAKKWFDRAA